MNFVFRVNCPFKTFTSLFDIDFTLPHRVCVRMLRGASMIQDFPILTGTNNLESL